MTNTELTNKIRQIKELQRMAEELDAELEALKDSVKAEMTERGTDKITVDIFKVTWSTVTSNRIDTTALKKELPEIASKYTKATESRRFVIS